MSVERLESLFSEMATKAYGELKSEVESTVYTEFDIQVSIFAPAMMRAFERAVNAIDRSGASVAEIRQLDDKVAEHNTLENWRDAMIAQNIKITGSRQKSLFGEWVFDRINYPNARQTTQKGIINLDDDGNGNVTFLNSPAGVQYDTFLRNYRDGVYDRWKELHGGDFEGGEEFQTTAKGKISHLRQDAEYDSVAGGVVPRQDFGVGAHDPKRTLNVGLLEIRLPDILGADLIANTTEGDIIKDFLASCDLEWFEQTVEVSPGVTEQKRVLRIVPGLGNPTGPYDKEQIGNSPLLNEYRQFLETSPYFAHATAADIDASVPFRQQAAAAAQYKLIRDIMRKNKSHIYKKTIKTKEPKKKSPRKKTFKSPIRPIRKKGIKRLRGKKSVLKVVREGGTRPKTTQGAADLVRLRKYIQGRLPAEVRRNMGRPALQNQTGRFSQSVELKSLHQTAQTVVAKYTYLLRPYSTFENTGKRRWPLAYNPKTLIAKSIRNLAQGRIEQKLTVRRV